MVDDYGLIGGLGKGIQAAADMYMKTKQLNRNNQIQEMTSGLVDDGNGNLDYSPAKKQAMQAQALQTQDQIDQRDPNSQKSIDARALAKSIVHNATPGAENGITDTMTAADLNQEGGLVGKAVSGGFGMQGAQMKANAIGAGSAGRNDIARDNQTSRAVDEVTKDPLITHTYIPRLQGAQRIQSQFDAIKSGKIKDTSQLLGEMNLEYNNLATGTNSGALGKEEQTAYTTGEQKLAAMKQLITGNPESINSPEIMKQLSDQIDDLKGVYQGAITQRAKMLQRNYAHNPDATKAQQDKIQEMTSQFGAPQDQGLIGNQTQQAPQQQAPNASLDPSKMSRADKIKLLQGQ